jgi:dTMP kinase
MAYDKRLIHRGFELVIEGPDGAGKTTLAAGLIKRLTELGLKIVSARHPGTTPLGQELRKIIKNRTDITFDRYTEQLLMAADRCDYIEQVLKPAIENGTIVLSDRSNFVSGMIYGLAGGLSWRKIHAMHNCVLAAEPPRTHLIVLSGDYDTLKARQHDDVVVENGKEKIVKCKIEARGDEFHRRVNHLYNLLADVKSCVYPQSMGYYYVQEPGVDHTKDDGYIKHKMADALRPAVYHLKKDGIPMSIHPIDATLSQGQALDQAERIVEQILDLIHREQLV